MVDSVKFRLDCNLRQRRKEGKIYKLSSCGELNTKVVYQGVEYEADLESASAWDGMPWLSGRIRIEQNPELYPLFARGYGFKPGVFYELLQTPTVETALEKMVGAVQGAPIGLRRAKVPSWEDNEENRAREARQWEYCQRVWREWTRPENEDNLQQWIAWSLRTTPLFGFSIWEVVAEPVLWQLAGDEEPRIYWVPKLPLWRAPWSVDRWIQQRDDIVGVVLRDSQQVTVNGYSGPVRVALSADKILVVAARQMGKNPEGRSHLRSSVKSIEFLRNDCSLESRARQINGLGTMIVNMGEDGAATDEAKEIREHLDNYEAKHVPFMMLPNGWDVKMLSPNSATPDYTASINRNKIDIAMSLSAESSMMGLLKHGSYAARRSASQDNWIPYTQIGTDYVATPLTQFLARFVKANFCDGPTYAPGVHYGKIEKLDLAGIVEIASKAGITGNQKFIDFVVRELGL